MRYTIAIVILCILISGCSAQDRQEPNDYDFQPVNQIIETPKERTNETPATPKSTETPPIDLPPPNEITLINPEGTTVKERFLVPEGFKRTDSTEGSFANFLQTLPLKEDGAKVRYFDGREKNRDVYMAVIDYSLGERDLQQCADAVMRLMAEYLYHINQHDKIKFNFVSGFCAEFSKWSEGYGITVSGNNVSWVKNNNNNDSYESFQKYLNIVYAYSSTLSLEKELVSKDINELAIGDVFIEGGSPGHCVIVVDTASCESTGETLFMLAQSYMPAQDIQILKGDKKDSPWYTSKDLERLITPEWVFELTHLKTW